MSVLVTLQAGPNGGILLREVPLTDIPWTWSGAYGLCTLWNRTQLVWYGWKLVSRPQGGIVLSNHPEINLTKFGHRMWIFQFHTVLSQFPKNFRGLPPSKRSRERLNRPQWMLISVTVQEQPFPLRVDREKGSCAVVNAHDMCSWQTLEQTVNSINYSTGCWLVWRTFISWATIYMLKIKIWMRQTTTVPK